MASSGDVDHESDGRNGFASVGFLRMRVEDIEGMNTWPLLRMYQICQGSRI
jgi:hypothetical protein